MKDYTRFILDELRDDIDLARSIQATAELFHGDAVRDECTEERRQKLVSWVNWYTVLVATYEEENLAACRAQLETLKGVAEHYRGVMEGRYVSGEQCFWFCPCPESPCEHML